MKKKNILHRIEDIEKLNDEKDMTIKFLSEKVEKLELSLKSIHETDEVENFAKMVPCEFCDFSAKNERGLKLHIKAKHEITKVELTIFCKATEKYLNSDRDCYKKELESEIDVLEDIVNMEMDSSKVYDYVGKFLPTKVIIRTRIPAKWENEVLFRKQIWERINKRIIKGKISEEKDGRD